MLHKNKVAALAILTFIIIAVSPLTVLAQEQIQENTAQQIFSIAERASLKVQDLIASVEANPDAAISIEEAGLTEQYTGNVTLFETEGADSLALAEVALADSDYDATVENAFDALGIFREVYRSIQNILGKAGLQTSGLTEGQGLLEAIDRELQRIERLTNLLPEDTPQDIKDLLEVAENLINEAKVLLLEDNIAEAKTVFVEAKENIVEVYQYIKEQAEIYNEWRLNNYCQGLQERMRERLRYGRECGVNVDSVLQSFGYQSESQLMDSIQNQIQSSLDEQNFGLALKGCEQVSNVIQQMEQVLNHQGNQQQGQSGSGSNAPGYGGNGGKP
jgi:hypothetical protein